MDELTINDIQQIIEKDESRTVELKTSTSEIDKGMTSACAFLNSDGGWLLFGVTPKLKIVGQNVTDNTKQEIAKYLNRIEPSIDISVQYIPVPDKPDFYVIAIYFDPTSFTNAPYTYDGRPYYKVESTTTPMPRQMYEDRLKISNPERFSWEKRPNRTLKLEDLDVDELFLTVQDSVARRRLPGSAIANADPMRALKGFHLVSDDGVILNAANVLFGKEPTMHHLQCMVRLARFEGTTKRTFRDQAISEGNLFQQYDAVLNFCNKHLFLAGNMDGKVRIDTLTVPYKVLKESTINMLVHRSWDADNLTPSLAIYDDRMVFQNPGTFPIGYTWQSFLEDAGSIPSNPTIASVFYRRGLMESWGRGISLIIDECVKAGLPEPTFKADQHFVTLTIWFKEPLSPSETVIDTNDLKDGLKDGLKGGLKDEQKEKMTDGEITMFDALKANGNLTNDELAKQLGISVRTVRRILASLKEMKIIHREGGRKEGRWLTL